MTVGNAMAGVRTLKEWLKRAPNLYDHAGERVTPLTRLLLRSALNAGSAPPHASRQYATASGAANVRSPMHFWNCKPVTISNPAWPILRTCNKALDAVLSVVPAFPK